MTSSSDLKKHAKFFRSLQEPFDPGPFKENLNVLEPRVDIEDTKSKACSVLTSPRKKVKPQVNLQEETSVMPESPATPKRKIWIPSVSSSELDTLIMNASEILDRALISKERGFCQFWTQRVGEISEKLSSLTETDYAGSDLKLLNESYRRAGGKSWFSITTSCPPNRNSSKIFSQLLQSSVPDCTVCEVTHSKTKLGVWQRREQVNLTGKKYKTLKVRLFPNKDQEDMLIGDSSRLRWYENAYNDIFPLDDYMKLIDKAKEDGEERPPLINWKTFQSKLKDYEYLEEQIGNMVDETHKTSMPVVYKQLKLKKGCKNILEDIALKEEINRKENERKKLEKEDKKKRENDGQEKIELTMSKEDKKVYRKKLKEDRKIATKNKRLRAKEEVENKKKAKLEEIQAKKQEREDQKKIAQTMPKDERKLYEAKLAEDRKIAAEEEAKNKKPRNTNEYPYPSWMENTFGKIISSKTNERIIRGAVANFTQNLNSAVSNYFNGNIKSFELRYRTAKDKHEFINFTDEQLPVWYKDLHGSYSYRFPAGHAYKRRTSIAWNDLMKTHKGSVIIIQDKQTKCWYGCLPVERDWYPPFDHRSENQGPMKKGEAIGLDPGMRKFLAGFTTTGETIYFGDRAFKIIGDLYSKISWIDSELAQYRAKMLDLSLEQKENLCKEKQAYWNRVKNLVTEMHWKCIRFLVLNYEYIFLEDFSTKGCIKKKPKGQDLSPLVKRILGQYSFYKFKQRLAYSCDKYGRKLILVHPARTTKDCPYCGNEQNVERSETYDCPKCNRILDRDQHSALNVLVKGMSILESRN